MGGSLETATIAFAHCDLSIHNMWAGMRELNGQSERNDWLYLQELSVDYGCLKVAPHTVGKLDMRVQGKSQSLGPIVGHLHN